MTLPQCGRAAPQLGTAATNQLNPGWSGVGPAVRGGETAPAIHVLLAWRIRESVLPLSRTRNHQDVSAQDQEWSTH